jgi:hypothetical protein
MDVWGNGNGSAIKNQPMKNRGNQEERKRNQQRECFVYPISIPNIDGDIKGGHG